MMTVERSIRSGWFARTLGLLGCLLLIGSLVACGDETDPEAGFDEGKKRDTTQGVRITKIGHGPDFDGFAFEITGPAADAVVTGDSIPISVTIGGLELKSPTPGEGANNLNYSKDGQHVHIIVDNEPYMAMYDTTFNIGGLTPGAHTLRAFPSRSWHESVKTPGAFVARTFYVGSKEGTPVLQATAPLLTYSRPKGEYVGNDARKILLDFYVSNGELGADKHKVVVSIDGAVVDTLDEWSPYVIEGLKDGEHTIRLQLIGPDGAPVANGPFNDTERTITVASKKSDKSASKSEGKEGEELEKDIHDAGRHIQGR